MKSLVLVTAAPDGVSLLSEDCAVPDSGGRHSNHNPNTGGNASVCVTGAAIRRTRCLISGCYNTADTDGGCRKSACIQPQQGKSRHNSRSSLTTVSSTPAIRLFELMGLSVSVWPYNRTDDRPPAPSSVFPPLAVPTSSRLAVTLNSSPVAPGDSRSHWSSTHHSPHFLLSTCKQEVTRSPVEQSSDGARAEMGVKSGLHVWEVLWNPRHRGSHAVLGVSTQDCPLRASGYNVLVGGESQSWGWELKTSQLWHSGQCLGLYPREQRRRHPEGPQSSISSHSKMAQATLPIPERILLVLDADAGTLGFIVDGSFLGVAFKDLPLGVELFPAVSSVRGGATIRLRYLNGATCDPPALMALCGLSIHRYLGQQRQNQMHKLPLPPRLQHYVLSSQ